MTELADGLNVRWLWEEQCARIPNHEFLVFEDTDTEQIRRYTYRAFDDEVNRAANMFLGRGVQAGIAWRYNWATRPSSSNAFWRWRKSVPSSFPSASATRQMNAGT
ncbi:hypothetical protein [Actinobaculum sp. 313]|uniref:hypothetical protein n=1 Tax=Actinobaculum sp. 313 TaxID=2495645 RepID=UPI003204F8A7